MVALTPEMLGIVEEIRALGVGLSVDDFGTGYSSLTNLVALPVTEVKIDRSFISGMQDQPGLRSLVSAVAGLGRSLGLTVVAEGVETDDQRTLLHRLDGPVIQGYFFSPPLPPERAADWIGAHRNGRASSAPAPAQEPTTACTELTAPDSERLSALYRSMIDHAPDAALLVEDGTIVYANREAGRLFGGGDPDTLLHRPAELLLPAAERAGMRDRLEASRRTPGRPIVGKLRFAAADETGREAELTLQARSLTLQADAVWIAQLGFRDITEQDRAQQEAEHLARHDAVTGLPNRRRIREVLERLSQKPEHPFGVIAVDLDNFKDINDGYGHDIGDDALAHAGRRLREILAGFSGDAAIARYGGDEFLAILPGAHSSTELQEVLDAIVTGLPEPVSLDGRPMRIFASAGGALFPGDARSADEVLKAADLAMYRAKRLGRSRAVRFTEDLAEQHRRVTALERDLRDAIAHDQLELHYQPKADAASGRITGFEALMRWHHPTEGLIPPDTFIALAEASTLIIELGSWALREACAQARSWIDAGVAAPPISVNVSGHQILYRDLVSEVREILDQTRLPAGMLQIELTETVLAQDPDLVSRTLGALADMGVTTAIDDFGTGNSSLNYLRSFPARTLKIDQAFTANLLTDPDDAEVVHATISLAHSLGYRVIAEGVETVEQSELLREIGCDEIQGWYLGHPVAVAEVAEIVRRQSRTG